MSDGAKAGLWLVGIAGGVGSTVALGLAALRRGLIPPTGLVTALEPFRGVDLTPWENIVLGGHELRPVTLSQAVQEMHTRARLFGPELISACRPDLEAIQSELRSGLAAGHDPQAGVATADPSPRASIERLAADLMAFRERHRLNTVVLVNVASTEPAPDPALRNVDETDFERALDGARDRPLRESILYALAAIDAGCAYVNFTPSVGIDLPVLRRRADERCIPYMGNDGKTGETLVKSALAPMFAMRNLPVLGWFGQNLLGNRDGESLCEPGAKAAKVHSKDRLLPKILGETVPTGVSIDFAPSVHDWKVAWDFIHFEGFLGTRMNMQFTWQGSDSALAAPLVLDLARLATIEMQASRGGPMRHLAFFFKDPIDVDGHDLATQWHALVNYVQPR